MDNPNQVEAVGQNIETDALQQRPGCRRYLVAIVAALLLLTCCGAPISQGMFLIVIGAGLLTQFLGDRVIRLPRSTTNIITVLAMLIATVFAALLAINMNSVIAFANGFKTHR